MRTLSKDAKGFVEGIARYVTDRGLDKTIDSRVHSLLEKVSDDARHAGQGMVVSCVEMTAMEKQSLSDLLGRALGHDVTLAYRIDPSLLGGFQVKVADWIVDASLKTQMARMVDSLS